MRRIATTVLVAGLIATPMLALSPPASADVSIGISIGIAPPPMPVYAQPMIPGPGYIWTPGYWAWDPGYGGYYWVPGTWVMPPMVGLLWTPGWWGWSDGYYSWRPGYWGSRVGFYGGVNYGFGYFGTGYVGGEWRGNDFYYNRAVNNINVTNIRTVYINRTVINNVNINRVSYNGGNGGLTARPSATQRAIAKERRWSPTSMQTRQRDTAMRNPTQRFTTNQSHPAVFATQSAGHFEGRHTVRTPAAATSRMIAAPERAPANAARRRLGHTGPGEQPQQEMQREQRREPNAMRQYPPRDEQRVARREAQQAHGERHERQSREGSGER